MNTERQQVVHDLAQLTILVDHVCDRRANQSASRMEAGSTDQTMSNKRPTEELMARTERITGMKIPPEIASDLRNGDYSVSGLTARTFRRG